jgi:hypothetical protein
VCFCYDVPFRERYSNATSKYCVAASGKSDSSHRTICNCHVSLSLVTVGVNVKECLFPYAVRELYPTDITRSVLLLSVSILWCCHVELFKFESVSMPIALPNALPRVHMCMWSVCDNVFIF